MRTVVTVITLVLLLPLCSSGQDEESWPPLSYLRSDYKAVSAVAHVRIREAEIAGTIVGYENWRVSCEVLESFKGRFRKGDVVEFFHGAEAGLRKEYFTGQKIVFLLADYDKKMKLFRYSVLENSTLPYSEELVKKLRVVKRSYAKRKQRDGPGKMQ